MPFQGNLAALVGTLLGIALLTLLIVAAVLTVFILRNKHGKNNDHLSVCTFIILRNKHGKNNDHLSVCTFY